MKFEAPVVELVKFDVSDILTTSNAEICDTDCQEHSCPTDTGEFG